MYCIMCNCLKIEMHLNYNYVIKKININCMKKIIIESYDYVNLKILYIDFEMTF